MGVELTKVYYRGIRTAPQKGYFFSSLMSKAYCLYFNTEKKKKKKSCRNSHLYALFTSAISLFASEIFPTSAFHPAVLSYLHYLLASTFNQLYYLRM